MGGPSSNQTGESALDPIKVKHRAHEADLIQAEFQEPFTPRSQAPLAEIASSVKISLTMPVCKMSVVAVLIAGQATPETRQAALRRLFERRRNSPDPVYRDYRDKMTQEACETFADLHNSTTATQRGNAVEILKGYEQDFRTLNGQQS